MAEKILNSYETIFIIDATLTEEQVTELKDKFVGLIEKNGEVLVDNRTTEFVTSEEDDSFKVTDHTFEEFYNWANEVDVAKLDFIKEAIDINMKIINMKFLTMRYKSC